MSKAVELWEKYSTIHRGLQYMDEPQFLAALKEYGESVRKQAVSVCRDKSWEYESESGIFAADRSIGAGKCAAAIEKMELP